MTDCSPTPVPRPVAASPLIVSAVLVAAAFAALFASAIASLVTDWDSDDYSHGFLIVPLAAYFAWERRGELTAAVQRPSTFGLLAVMASVALHIAGVLGSETFLSRIAMIGALAGAIVFVAGWAHLRALSFPVLFLLLAVPIPKLVFYEIAFPLQLLASRFGEAVLVAARVPVLREGNVLVLATTSLEVADACSGIRSLMSLLAVGIVYAYFTETRAGLRLLLVASTVPIAIVTNGLRIAGTGLAAAWVGPEAADHLFHTFSGWLVFVCAVALLVGVHRAATLVRRAEGRRGCPVAEPT